ncbi:hypothetical protein DV704_05335 [Meiothermus sp. QL-1]|uniref:hypothetical protein n=1 Tax=Meiothermus sp. QL-1 TaxID=2058095 RepID=UPI000E0C5127|nr:hypothetical protein [Meiothermus sp. QL-1]RDI95700.1 hypothetical protein DV704_05335 [Meiothermus sp. QL-1]
MKHLLLSLGVLLAAGIALGQPEAYRLRVLAWSCKAFPRGVLVQGMVLNTGSRPISDLRANVRVVGPGLRIATHSAPLADRNLMPGERAFFEVRVPTPFAGLNRCELWFRNPRLVRIPALIPTPR